MNVAALQKKDRNVETRTGKRKAGEGRRQATDFKESVSCHSAVVQGGHGEESQFCIIFPTFCRLGRADSMYSTTTHSLLNQTLGKNGFCEGVSGITEIFGKANSHFDLIKTGSETAPPR